MKTVDLTWSMLRSRAVEVSQDILLRPVHNHGRLYAYPVPRGGVYAGLILQEVGKVVGLDIELVDDPAVAHIYIDDIIDSGETRNKYQEKSPKRFYALVDKTAELEKVWYTFPWERLSGENGPQENVKRLLEYIGDDPNREGLKDTPGRVIRSFDELYSGYKKQPSSILTVFKDDSCNEMVVLKDVEFYSTCEHHMLPFFGCAHVAYIPNGRVIGVSKLARLLEIYSRRLQIQERICQQVTSALDEFLKPQGSACVLQAQHFCMTSRGVQKQNSIMVTSSLTGSFLEGSVRNEFLNFIRS